MIAWPSLLRVVLSVLAFAHTFPARKHLALLWAEPSLGEAWKGIGPVGAIVLCCMPTAWYARGVALLRSRARLLFGVTAGVVAAHLVAAVDHLPALVARPSWSDGWRGLGSAVAVVWFIAPTNVQGRVVGFLRGVHAPRLVYGMRGSTMSRFTVVVATAAIFGAGVIAGAIHIATSSAAPPPPSASDPAPQVVVLHVPHATAPMRIDGALDEPVWNGAARTHAFVRGDGSRARPYSDARIVWGDGKLYVALYAADEDIRVGTGGARAPSGAREDAFHLFFANKNSERGLDVAADASVVTRVLANGAPWSLMPEVAHETDGTVNDNSDDDEEWVIELAIPLAEFGLRGEPGERVSFAARRCDTPKGARRTCGTFGGDLAATLVLD